MNPAQREKQLAFAQALRQGATPGGDETAGMEIQHAPEPLPEEDGESGFIGPLTGSDYIAQSDAVTSRPAALGPEGLLNFFKERVPVEHKEWSEPQEPQESNGDLVAELDQLIFGSEAGAAPKPRHTMPSNYIGPYRR